MSKHALIWLDHQEARVFHMDDDKVDAEKLKAPKAHLHRHPKGSLDRKEHPEDVKKFFDSVAEAVKGIERLLIVGPGSGKLELVRYAHAHNHDFEKRVVGIETLDHPTDGQLVAYARTYFKADDRMH
jgi:stalled ribosome rescue protein Dom34